MSILATERTPRHIEIKAGPQPLCFRPEISTWIDIKVQADAAREQNDYLRLSELLRKGLKLQPQDIMFHLNMAVNELDLNNPEAAWQALGQAWKIAPNTYAVLSAMAFYFLQMKNFEVLEKTSHLILEIAPSDLAALGFLTQALLGMIRYPEALRVGLPLIELSAAMGELPNGMGFYPIKQMADFLLEQKDYPAAVRLWAAGVKCQPDNVSGLLEFGKALILVGDQAGARQCLSEIRKLAPQDEAVRALQMQLDPVLPPRKQERA